MATTFRPCNPVSLLTAILILCIPALTGCDAPIRDGRLTDISRRLNAPDISPQEALKIHSALDSIAPGNLNEAERNLRAFLTIKAADKGFLAHTDSTAIEYEGLLRYFAGHHKEIYPEVLYYGGRIHSDIGDYQTALSFYADALDRTNGDMSALPLNASINSQAAHLLNKMRLYNPAMEHLEAAIRIDSILKDTLNMAYDLQLAASIANRQGNPALARSYALRTIPLSISLEPSLRAETYMYLARAAHKTGNLQEARRLIANVTEQVDEIAHNEAAPVAAEIYLDAGSPDSAFMLANSMLESSNPLNRHIAYHLILSKKLRHLLNPDSITEYNDRYYLELDGLLDQNANKAALIQYSVYNYNMHERKRLEAERKQHILFYWFCGVITVSAIVLTVLLFIRHRQQKHINTLLKRLNEVRIFKDRIKAREKETGNDLKAEDIVNHLGDESREWIRNKFRKEIEDFNKEEKERRHDKVDQAILLSDCYARLQALIKDKRPLKDTDPLWDQLKETVKEESPDFFTNLIILAGATLSEDELKTALLIKCGVRPSQLATLLSLSPSGIGSRRQTMAQKIFGQKINTRMIDELIRQI